MISSGFDSKSDQHEMQSFSVSAAYRMVTQSIPLNEQLGEVELRATKSPS